MELLSPAGSLEKLKAAVIYGADGVYFAGTEYGLRANAENFSPEDMEEGIKFAHSHNCKAYVTINIIPHESDLEGISEYVRFLEQLGADAVIISDPGVFSMVSRNVSKMGIHISTQANNTNSETVNFWHRMGASRVVLARELTLEEIKAIRRKVPPDMELEVFVHGAMCASYSGRCLLSNYLTGRDSNRGDCSQPCRWKYYLMEEKRPGLYMPVFEDSRGTFIMNSKDLCMINHMPELFEAGVSSMKIEGRMKSLYYAAIVTRAYRMAIDSYKKDPLNYRTDPELIKEVETVSHREYCTGFYFGRDPSMQVYGSSTYIRNYEFIGIVKGFDSGKHLLEIEQRNHFSVGDELEAIQPSPQMPILKFRVEKMYDQDMNPLECAPHPKMKVLIPGVGRLPPWTLVRKRVTA